MTTTTQQPTHRLAATTQIVVVAMLAAVALATTVAAHSLATGNGVEVAPDTFTHPHTGDAPPGLFPHLDRQTTVGGAL